MIDARELRIGNLVYNHKGEVVKWNGDYYHWIDDELKPILLGEDYLLRFGFVYTETIQVQFNEYRKDLLSLSITPNGYEIFYTFRWIKIKHVHQLQNLYFALTGEELTIKEP